MSNRKDDWNSPIFLYSPLRSLELSLISSRRRPTQPAPPLVFQVTQLRDSVWDFHVHFIKSLLKESYSVYEVSWRADTTLCENYGKQNTFHPQPSSKFNYSLK